MCFHWVASVTEAIMKYLVIYCTFRFYQSEDRLEILRNVFNGGLTTGQTRLLQALRHIGEGVPKIFYLKLLKWN